MSTIDRVEKFQVCPCGHGEIRIVEYSPDHPYARDSQTSYTAEICCNKCQERYVIDDAQIEGKRYIILKPNDMHMDIIKLRKIDMFCVGLTR